MYELSGAWLCINSSVGTVCVSEYGGIQEVDDTHPDSRYKLTELYIDLALLS